MSTLAETDVLLVVTGGSPEPIIETILLTNPNAVIYFASEGSRRLIHERIQPEILKRLDDLPDSETVITPDAQDLGSCVAALLDGVPAALKALAKRLGWPDRVDYTGGTKTMSAAAVWVCSHHNCLYSYIGSAAIEGREKNGLGLVINGYERMLLQENPWDALPVHETAKALYRFNEGRYDLAYMDLKRLLNRLSPHHQNERELKVLCTLAEGYMCWDAFEYEQAQSLLIGLRSQLELVRGAFGMIMPALPRFLDASEATFLFLDGIQDNCGGLCWNLIWDLLANANRRALLEKRFDDAAARCIAALRKIVRYELLRRYNIDPHQVRPEQLPNETRQWYSRRNSMCDGQLWLTLHDGYVLLRELGSNYGKRWFENTGLQEALNDYDETMFTSGVRGVSPLLFKSLFDGALKVLDLSPSDLPSFPIWKA